jgi:hypothetical protein
MSWHLCSGNILFHNGSKYWVGEGSSCPMDLMKILPGDGSFISKAFLRGAV